MSDLTVSNSNLNASAGSGAGSSAKQIIADAHYDLLMDVTRLRNQGETHVIEKYFLDDLKAAGVNVLVCSLFVPSEYIPEMALRVALKQIANLHAEMRDSPGVFSLCRSAAEARTAVGKGQVAIFLSFEGVDPLGQDLQMLKIFHELGVRLVGLTWSRRNFAADGCHFNPLQQGVEGGLTAFGVSLLNEIKRLGMIVDISHLNDTGVRDVFKLYDGPIIASHSNCRALCPVARNLTDDMIKQLAARGGVVGMNNMAAFVYKSDNASKAKGWNPAAGSWGGWSVKGGVDAEGNCNYGGMLEHIRHIIDLVGPDHVGLGMDLCEFDKPLERRDDGIFPTYRHARPFIDAIQKSFDAETSAKILGENWMRVLSQSSRENVQLSLF